MAGLNHALGHTTPADILEKLYSHVRTVEELLACDVDALSEDTGLSCERILSLRRAVLAEQAAVPVRGDQLYRDMLGSALLFTTGGCAGLDHLLFGGAYTGEVLEVSGASAAGKTQLCHCMALHAAVRHGCDVMYVDSGGSFSSQRLLQLSTARSVKDKQWQSLIRSAQVYDIFEFTDLLDDLLATDRASPPARLLIVDCLTSIMTGDEDLVEAKRYVARILGVIATEHSMAVVYTNTLLMEGTALALSKVFRRVPNTRLHLTSSAGTGHGEHVYTATVLRSSHRAYGLASAVTLSDAGFCDIPPRAPANTERTSASREE